MSQPLSSTYPSYALPRSRAAWPASILVSLALHAAVWTFLILGAAFTTGNPVLEVFHAELSPEEPPPPRVARQVAGGGPGLELPPRGDTRPSGVRGTPGPRTAIAPPRPRIAAPSGTTTAAAPAAASALRETGANTAVSVAAKPETTADLPASHDRAAPALPVLESPSPASSPAPATPTPASPVSPVVPVAPAPAAPAAPLTAFAVAPDATVDPLPPRTTVVTPAPREADRVVAPKPAPPRAPVRGPERIVRETKPTPPVPSVPRTPDAITRPERARPEPPAAPLVAARPASPPSDEQPVFPSADVLTSAPASPSTPAPAVAGPPVSGLTPSPLTGDDFPIAQTPKPAAEPVAAAPPVDPNLSALPDPLPGAPSPRLTDVGPPSAPTAGIAPRGGITPPAAVAPRAPSPARAEVAPPAVPATAPRVGPLASASESRVEGDAQRSRERGGDATAAVPQPPQAPAPSSRVSAPASPLVPMVPVAPLPSVAATGSLAAGSTGQQESVSAAGAARAVSPLTENAGAGGTANVPSTVAKPNAVGTPGATAARSGVAGAGAAAAGLALSPGSSNTISGMGQAAAGSASAVPGSGSLQSSGVTTAEGQRGTGPGADGRGGTEVTGGGRSATPGTGTGTAAGSAAGGGTGTAAGTGAGTASASTAQPSPAGGRITISSPRDGLRLGPDDAPVVIVEGEVNDPGATAVWLFANKVRVRAPLKDGRFRHVLPVLEKDVRIQAETSGAGDRLIRSEVVTVHADTVTETAAVIVVDAPDVRVTGSWRGNPARVDVPVYPVTLKTVDPASGLPRGIFYVRNLREGVYTLSVGASSTLPESSVMYVRAENQVTAHPLGSENGMLSRIVTKLLMPFGVLWDQNGWFTGRSEGADTLTKFRFPEGVSWTERKSDLRR